MFLSDPPSGKSQLLIVRLGPILSWCFLSVLTDFVMLQIIAAQEEMLRKERELDEARKKLAMIRQQHFGKCSKATFIHVAGHELK